MAGWLGTSSDDPDTLSRAAPGGPVTPNTDLPGPGAFASAGTFAKNVGMLGMQGFAATARGINFLGGAFPALYGDVTGNTDAADAYFRRTVDPAQDAVNFWTPDARTAGPVTHFVGGMVKLGAEAMAGGMVPLLTAEQTGAGMDLVNQGVDPATANKVSMVVGASNALGLELNGFGNTLFSRMVSGATQNVALSGGSAIAQKTTIDAAGASIAQPDAKDFGGVSGNIDLDHRPRAVNPDGSVSTVRSMSIGTDAGEVLIPTVSEDGRVMSDAEAIAQFRKTGRNLGTFKSPDAADAYAEALHNAQARRMVYTDAAQAFDVWAPHARAIDLLTGAVVGGLAHRGALPGTPAAQDTILTAANADRVQNVSAPAKPANAVGTDQHVSALDAAIAAAVRGEPVDVAAAINPADFHVDQPNPRAATVAREARTSAVLGNLTGTSAAVRDAAVTAGADPSTTLAIAQIESRMDPNAANPKSSAKGIGQFLDSTWQALGGTDANRFDVATQARLLAELTVKNTDDLRTALGREPEPAEVYLAHLLGVTGAKRVLSADQDAMISDVIGQKAADLNGMHGMTVWNAVNHWKAVVDRAVAYQPAPGAVVPAYHGTNQVFEHFGDDKQVGKMRAAMAGGSMPGRIDGMFYFTDDPRTAGTYADGDGGTNAMGEPTTGNIRPVNIDTTNFHEVDAGGAIGDERSNVVSKAIDDAIDRKRDGVIIRNVVDPLDHRGVDHIAGGQGKPSTVYVAFRRDQITSRFERQPNSPRTSATPTPVSAIEPTSTSASATTGERVIRSESMPTDDTPAAGEVKSGPEADLETARQTAEANPDLIVPTDDGGVVSARDALAQTDLESQDAEHFSQLYQIAINCALRGGH